MERDLLLELLRVTRPALGGNLVKGLDCYHIDSNKVTAFNGSLLITVEALEPLPVKGAIVGDSLYKLVKELGKEIELEAPEPESLVIKSGRSKTRFAVDTVDAAFLADAEESEKKNFLPIGVVFAAGLKRCMTSVMASKGSSSEGAGIHIFIEENECKIYSSNGVTYSRFSFPFPEPMEPYSVFLPAAFCEQLIFMYSEMNENPESIIVSDKYIRAKFKNVLMRSSFYANPVNTELRTLIDEGVEQLAITDLTEDFREAVKRSEIIAGGTPIKISYGEGENRDLVTIMAKGNQSQEIKEEIDMPFPVTGTLYVDVKNLSKVISSCKEIGFGSDYILLIGSEGSFDHIISARN